MSALFFAGEIPTVDELNDMAGIGEEVLDVTADTDSAVWNSTTKVLTNLTGAFSAIAGHKYLVTVRASVNNSVNALGYLNIGVVMKEGGAAVGTDTLLDGPAQTRSNELGGIYNMVSINRFTAGTTTTIGLAVVGWRFAGSNAGNLYGVANQNVNRMHVTRIG